MFRATIKTTCEPRITNPALIRCDRCLFGRAIVTNEGKRNESTAYECHISRPTTKGFPIVRADDFCAFHADCETGARALIAFSAINTATA